MGLCNTDREYQYDNHGVKNCHPLNLPRIAFDLDTILIVL